MTRAKKAVAKRNKAKAGGRATDSQNAPNAKESSELTEAQLSNVAGGAMTGALVGAPSATIPAASQEVVVAFVEGDPDRPIVVGNTSQMTRKP
jgi:hypothetical protein